MSEEHSSVKPADGNDAAATVQEETTISSDVEAVENSCKNLQTETTTTSITTSNAEDFVTTSNAEVVKTSNEEEVTARNQDNVSTVTEADCTDIGHTVLSKPENNASANEVTKKLETKPSKEEDGITFSATSEEASKSTVDATAAGGEAHESSKATNKGESSKSTKRSSKKKDSPPVTVTTAKAEALYAHNVVRKLHGVHELEWDQNLADEAKTWAQKLATKNSKLSHEEPVIGYGQNLYKLKGGSTSAKPYQAVLSWYRSIMQYKFNLPGYSSTTACATQLLWDETTHVGVAVAYREDIQTTYIVARYSPPGNDRFSESYIEHVKQPVKGLPPKVPKLEDLFPPDASENLSNMGTLFDVLCHWCVCEGEKPVEEISGVQPSQDNTATKNKPEVSQKTTKTEDSDLKREDKKTAAD